MQLKQSMKTVGIIAACAVVGIFLYSRKHEDYSTYQQNAERKEETGVTENSEIIIPEHYTKEVSELLTFDVEVTAGKNFNPTKFYAARATRSEMDADKIYDFFMGEEENVSKEVFNNYRDCEWTDVPLTEYQTDGKYLAISKYDFGYSKIPDINYVYNSFCITSSADQYNEYLYSRESNLDFMERDVAWEQLVRELETLGLDMSMAMPTVVYSLDMETMSAEEECRDIWGNELPEDRNPNWSKENEGYFYYIAQSYSNQGVPFCENTTLESNSIWDTPLWAFQSSEGLKLVHLSRWFDIQVLPERLTFVPFEDIMGVIEEKYSDTIQTDPLTVKKATLYSYPMREKDGTYSLIPIWLCTIEVTHPDDPDNVFTSEIRMAINAVTGEEMPALGGGA